MIGRARRGLGKINAVASRLTDKIYWMEDSMISGIAAIAKCLRDPLQQQARMSRIHDPHVAALSHFVDRVRAEGHPHVPYFDPLDGGVQAECLFVLEAPGSRAKESGFVSRNNPDETAKNWLELNVEADIERKRTAIWNVVPWYLGDGSQIRAAKTADIRHGLVYLLQVIEMFPNLRIVGLVGRAAGRVRSQIAHQYPKLTIVEVPHPSPTFINRSPQNRPAVLDGLRKIAALLNGSPQHYA
jgi:uracil-DNA glycosylase